jgi:hypothetical protein
MAYFDISSMLVALREQPDAFCLSGGLADTPTQSSPVQSSGRRLDNY